MPSKSPAQHRTMCAAAHNAEFAKKVGIPQGVGMEFCSADKKRKDLANALEAHMKKKK